MASGYSDMSEIQKNGRSFVAYPKPPKINLLNEKPRRESVVEQQLTGVIQRPEVNYQSVGQFQQVGPQFSQQQVYSQRSHELNNASSPNYTTSFETTNHVAGGGGGGVRGGVGNYYNTSSTLQDLTPSGYSGGVGPSYGYSSYSYGSQQYPQQQHPAITTLTSTTVKTVNTSNTGGDRQFSPAADGLSSLAAELAEKEAKLKREIAYLNQHHNPWSRPRQIREPRREPQSRAQRNDQRWVRECPSSPSSRPTSRASSTRSTSEADLMEKTAKLLQDAEELEKKPLTTQQILIESGVKPAPKTEASTSQAGDVSSVHTAVITVPRGEINNRSPLPFAFDNFSTLGVRGNIASVGAAEPETPYPPIFPSIKRTPSPTNKRR